MYGVNNTITWHDSTGKNAELVQNSLNFAQEIAAADGPLPFLDLIAAGIIVFAGGVWVWDNKSAIADGVNWAKKSIIGAFKAKSERIDWDIGENGIHHILHGTNDSHIKGWKQFGTDPKDPKSFLILLPYLKEAVDKGKETITNLGSRLGRIIEYVYMIEDKGFEIWVKIYEFPDGTRVLSDAAQYLPK